MRATTWSRLSLSDLTNRRSGTNGTWTLVLFPAIVVILGVRGVNTWNPAWESCL